MMHLVLIYLGIATLVFLAFYENERDTPPALRTPIHWSLVAGIGWLPLVAVLAGTFVVVAVMMCGEQCQKFFRQLRVRVTTSRVVGSPAWGEKVEDLTEAEFHSLIEEVWQKHGSMSVPSYVQKRQQAVEYLQALATSRDLEDMYLASVRRIDRTLLDMAKQRDWSIAQLVSFLISWHGDRYFYHEKTTGQQRAHKVLQKFEQRYTQRITVA